MLDCLKVYNQLGFPLFPCHAKDTIVNGKLKAAKSPITLHGFLDASLDLSQLEEWYKQFPGCAWGSRTRAERGAMDIDPRNGGNESLAKLIAEHGALPTTPKVVTGGGGFHYWLRGCSK